MSEERFELYRDSLPISQPGRTLVARGAGLVAVPSLAQVTVDDALSAPWCVTLSPIGRGAGIGSAQEDASFSPQLIDEAFAIVEWGRLGARAFAYVDWGARGTRFQVDGSFVRVSAGVRTLDPALIAGGAPDLSNLGAWIDPGRTQGRAYRTVLYGTIGTTSSVTQSIPPYARRFRVYFDQAPFPVAQLNSITLTGTTAAGGTVAWSFAPFVESVSLPGTFRVDTRPCPWFEMPQGAQSITIANNSATNAMDAVRIIYELSLD